MDCWSYLGLLVFAREPEDKSATLLQRAFRIVKAQREDKSCRASGGSRSGGNRSGSGRSSKNEKDKGGSKKRQASRTSKGNLQDGNGMTKKEHWLFREVRRMNDQSWYTDSYESTMAY